MKRTIAAAALILGSAALAAPAFAKEPEDHLSRLDKDGDGKVSVSELDARHKEFLGNADADGDGYITAEEMRAMHEKRMAEHKKRRFPDANNDGVVDRREFEDAARERFNEMDANGDGLISEDEMPDHRGGHHKRGR